MPLTSSSNYTHPASGKLSQGLMQRLKGMFITEKLCNPAGVALLALAGIFIAAGISYGGIVFGAAFLAVLAGLPLVYAVVVYPQFGIILLFIMAHSIAYLSRIGVPGPLGTVMDALQALLILGFFIKQKNDRNWKIFKGPLSIILLTWIGYNLLEVINPAAASTDAWLYTVRSVAVIALTYFVFVYDIRTVKFIRLLIKVWLVLSFIGAAYAFKQEYFGFSDAEQAYLNSSPLISDLLFIAGHWRKFSIFTDPVAFSYNMVVSGILCICLLTGTLKLWKKLVLAGLAAFCLMCMLYSGTRGANVLPPAALFLFGILKFNKKILIAGIVVGFFLLVAIVIPTSNPTLVRFQTTFRPNNDPSYLLRKRNQKRIQPYILTHPMGGGLGATGIWGKRFAPNSYLANFPPDSGYIRVAVELGWLGLLIFCTLMFIALKTGIDNYFKIKNPELKSYCLAAILIIFAMNIGNFPQEAIVQYPMSIIYYLALALPVITLRLDKQLRKRHNRLPRLSV